MTFTRVGFPHIGIVHGITAFHPCPIRTPRCKFLFLHHVYNAVPPEPLKEPTQHPLKLALSYLVVGGLSESCRASPTASKARWQFLGLGPVPPRI